MRNTYFSLSSNAFFKNSCLLPIKLEENHDLTKRFFTY